MYYVTTYDSPIGIISMVSDGKDLSGLWLEGQTNLGGIDPDKTTEKGDLPVFAKTRDWLDSYFAGENPSADELDLSPSGSEFRKKVWDILLEIPYGQLTTYGDIAKQMAKSMNKPTMSAQAVGGAVGHNPISIIIPCHRVVGTGGSLTGYDGGINFKIKLLELEGADTSDLFVPKKGTKL